MIHILSCLVFCHCFVSWLSCLVLSCLALSCHCLVSWFVLSCLVIVLSRDCLVLASLVLYDSYLVLSCLVIVLSHDSLVRALSYACLLLSCACLAIRLPCDCRLVWCVLTTACFVLWLCLSLVLFCDCFVFVLWWSCLGNCLAFVLQFHWFVLYSCDPTRFKQSLKKEVLPSQRVDGGNQAVRISSWFSGLIWIATLSVIPVSWGQQAPFYDTVQFEHAPSVNHKLGPLFCKNRNISRDVIKNNLRFALDGRAPLTSKSFFHYCCRISYNQSPATTSLPSLMRKCFLKLGMFVSMGLFFFLPFLYLCRSGTQCRRSGLWRPILSES